jgi:CDGSH-type Zn-finger protein
MVHRSGSECSAILIFRAAYSCAAPQGRLCSNDSVDLRHRFEILEEILAATKITVNNNGPLRVEGDFEIVDQTGKTFGLGGRTGLSLCRCGHSANAPFCDGSHKRQGFVSEITARDLPPPVVKPL